MRKISFNQRAKLIPTMIGIVSALLFSILMVMLAASAAISGYIQDPIYKYIVIFIHFISIFLTCMSTKLFTKELTTISAVLIGVVYLLCLLIGNLLIFSSGIHNAILTILSVTLGAAAGKMLFNKQRNRTKFRRRNVRIR